MISAARTTHQSAARSLRARPHLQAVPVDVPAASVVVPPALVALYRLPWAVRIVADVWADGPYPAAAATRHHQSQECRLVDLLWMLTVAADLARPGHPRRVTLWRVPVADSSGRSRRIRLILTITERPDGQSVATVTAPARRRPLARWRRIHADALATVAVALVMFGAMGSWVNICPGCRGRFRDDQMFLWHTELCDEYAALPVDGDPTPTTSEHPQQIPTGRRGRFR